MRLVAIEVAQRCEPHTPFDHAQTFLPTATDNHGDDCLPAQRTIRVPILRLFCTLPANSNDDAAIKCCIHLHQIYPYLLIRLPEHLERTGGEPEIECFIAQLWLSINRALSLCHAVTKTPPHDSWNSVNNWNNLKQDRQQHVMAIVLVSALDMYGYHPRPEPFLKIYLLNPSSLPHLADLLCQGAIMGRPMQPYESHLSFPLQFMIDYNLRGMDHLSLKYVRFRHPLSSQQATRISEYIERWDDVDNSMLSSSPPNNNTDSLIVENYWNGAQQLPRETVCELEGDAWPWDIRNREQVRQRPDEFCRPVFRRPDKLVPSLNGLWEVFIQAYYFPSNRPPPFKGRGETEKENAARLEGD